MSATYHYKGTLEKVSLPDETVGQATKRIDEAGELTSHKDFIAVDGALYKVTKEPLDPKNNLFRGFKTDNPNITDFVVRYYNGGCSFNDAMTAVIKDCNKVVEEDPDNDEEL